LGRGHRKKQTERMIASVQASFEDDDGLPKCLPQREHTRQPKICKVPKPSGSRFDPLSIEEASDADDDDFKASSDSGEESSSEDELELLNTEVELISALAQEYLLKFDFVDCRNASCEDGACAIQQICHSPNAQETNGPKRLTPQQEAHSRCERGFHCL
jgi:hypothetical protein